ncbi:isochorismatase family protein [Sorangium sp. So ce1335]|uniref:isochorismatase family protein n=1 Tax=Sorangium sp. So ce1335 TaxID=3133335 RepID=UPI003F62DF92
MEGLPQPVGPARTAPLIIGMQNDFLAEGGAFSKRHCDPHQLAQSVAWLARAARAQGRAVVWVTAAYGEFDADPDALRGQTHTGSACCARGTWGAEPVEREVAWTTRAPSSVLDA